LPVYLELSIEPSVSTALPFACGVRYIVNSAEKRGGQDRRRKWAQEHPQLRPWLERWVRKPEPSDGMPMMPSKGSALNADV
jgi:hypothetical protein